MIWIYRIAIVEFPEAARSRAAFGELWGVTSCEAIEVARAASWDFAGPHWGPCGLGICADWIADFIKSA